MRELRDHRPFDAVEAGLWTYEQFRRRGAAVAATTAWSGLHAERTVFYSTVGSCVLLAATVWLRVARLFN